MLYLDSNMKTWMIVKKYQNRAKKKSRRNFYQLLHSFLQYTKSWSIIIFFLLAFDSSQCTVHKWHKIAPRWQLRDFYTTLFLFYFFWFYFWIFILRTNIAIKVRDDCLKYKFIFHRNETISNFLWYVVDDFGYAFSLLFKIVFLCIEHFLPIP